LRVEGEAFGVEGFGYKVRVLGLRFGVRVRDLGFRVRG
jgi:hypothetical protein